MAAELHLAEDSLALHLLFQHLESLFDVVIADENLHAAFLFGWALMVSSAKGDRADGAGRSYNSGG